MHIYKVDSLPSQTQGLDVTTVQQPYFGVFGGRNNAAYGYTVAYSYKGKNPCGIYSRQDNSVSTWSARTAFQFSAPAELIRKGVGVVFDLGPDKALCDQPSATLATGITDPAVSFLWSTGESTADIQVTETGDYWVDVSDNCSTKRDKIHIDFQATPANVNLGADEMLCNVASKTLKPTAQTEDMTFTWQDGSTDAQFVVRDFGVYWVSVSNSCGVVSDTITISKKIYTLEGVPNVITPNGDAQNEHFRIPSEQSVGVIRLAVYNRWGMRVFFSSDYKNDWNGSGLSAGMYFYRLSGGCIADAKGALTILE
jgi:gliding motility-associated-like protein